MPLPATNIKRKEVYSFGFDRVLTGIDKQKSLKRFFSSLKVVSMVITQFILAYGQTGFRKSSTMEGGTTETTVGMIPRAVEQVFRINEFMKTGSGWQCKMEGQFFDIRSSRFHSVFTPRITCIDVGIGNVRNGDLFSSTSSYIGRTGERCEGSLNLVDLAGSERLNVRFAPGVVADKERVRETQD
ncbi:P-loop containing nucleoside triphosphate hydrolase protein [Amanita rubescens]|nr:P-loop containing nucleoside triphosphate hydrolase protein [Amanita rubescens]